MRGASTMRRGAQQPLRIEQLLDAAEGLGDARAELPLDPFAAAQAVAVLAAVGAAVLAHQRRRLLGDLPHLGRAIAPHVQDGPHVQRADRRMGVPGAARAVPAEYLGERVGVLGQVLQRHRAVLDEADRLAVALEAHHDVQAGLAHFPQRLLRRRRPPGAPRESGRPRSPISSTRRSRWRTSGAFSSPENSTSSTASGWPITAPRDHRREGRVLQRQLDHGAVHQFDRGERAFAQPHDVLGGIHRLVEGREVHHAQHLGARQRRQLQLQAARDRQRAFAAHQQVGQVDRAVGGVGPRVLVAEHVQVVAGRRGAAPWARARRSRAPVRWPSRAPARRCRARGPSRRSKRPKRSSSPSEVQASMPSTLWTMLPQAMLRLPQELLPAMPPSVAWALVDTSTGYHRPCFFSSRSGGPAPCRARPPRCARPGRPRGCCARAWCSRSPGPRPRSGRTGWCRRRAGRWAP